MLALRQTNVLLNIEVDGKGQLAVAKDVQRDPVRNVIEHIDLQVVRAGEKITVDISVNIVGESAPGTIHLVEEQTLSVEAEATHLPESVEVSIEGLESGSQIHAGEVALPEGSTLLTDPKAVVVLVTEPRGEASADEESAASAESPAEAPAEG
jgi:large subunit ribosomal protein L25